MRGRVGENIQVHKWWLRYPCLTGQNRGETISLPEVNDVAHGLERAKMMHKVIPVWIDNEDHREQSLKSLEWLCINIGLMVVVCHRLTFCRLSTDLVRCVLWLCFCNICYALVCLLKTREASYREAISAINWLKASSLSSWPSFWGGGGGGAGVSWSLLSESSNP